MRTFDRVYIDDAGQCVGVLGAHKISISNRRYGAEGEAAHGGEPVVVFGVKGPPSDAEYFNFRFPPITDPFAATEAGCTVPPATGGALADSNVEWTADDVLLLEFAVALRHHYGKALPRLHHLVGLLIAMERAS